MKKLVVMLVCVAHINADKATQNLARFMWANYCERGGNLAGAGHAYSQITPDTDSVYVYLGYIPYLAASGSFGEIVKLIPQLDEPFKNNQEMQLLFATALEQTGKKNEAHSRLVLLNDQNKSNQELAFKVVQMYLEHAEPENALKVIKNLLNNSPRRPNNFIFLFMESQIYLQLNKKPEALAAIKQCIDAYPKFDKSWLLYAVLHEQEGKIEEAIKGYTNFLEVSAQPNGEIERHLVMLAFRQKLQKQKNGFDNQHCLTQAAQFFDKKDYAKALASVDQCLAHNADDTEARLLKIQILAHQKQFDQATQLLENWMSKDKNIELWLKATHLLTYLGLPYEAALKTIEAVEKQKGSSLALTLYIADLALRAPQPEKALQALQKAYATSSDAALKTKIAHQIAIIYFDQQKWNLAQKTLEDAAALNYSYPPVNNLLAHIYATKSNTIAKAHEQIALALQKDPQNPHFLDTKALILYKENKFDQSIAILQKVAHVHPTDYTVLCHLGKCYYKNGNTKKAIDTMKAAVQIARNDHDKTKAEARLKEWSK
jgi:tetratricopeptide (TPR) repeat protein